jgi:hypothetical protein
MGMTVLERFYKIVRKTISFRSGMQSAPSEAVSAWCLLLLNVVANDGDGWAFTASGEVVWRAQRSHPELLSDGWIPLLANRASQWTWSFSPSDTAVMQRLQAFQYELMATGDQQRDMRRFAGACRFVFNNNADVVGAINILKRGHRLFACGGDLEARGPMKQEPTEMVA